MFPKLFPGILGLVLGSTTVIRADDKRDRAAAAIVHCQKILAQGDRSEREWAVYDLHDIVHPDIVAYLQKLMLTSKHRDVRNVAALALGGQGKFKKRTGAALAAGFMKHFKDRIVLSSILNAWGESGDAGYWPLLRRALHDKRNSIAIRAILLLAENADPRAFEELLKMYLVLAPERPPKSGKGTQSGRSAANEGADPGRESAKQTARARSRAERIRNYEQYLLRYFKAVTRLEFDNPYAAYEWWVTNYVSVARRIAVLNEKNPKSAAERARRELPQVQKRVARLLAHAGSSG